MSRRFALVLQYYEAVYLMRRYMERLPVDSRSNSQIKRLLAEAEPLYALAAQGFDAIPAPNRRAVKIACVLYRGIGRKIMDTPAAVYWSQRVQLSKVEKALGVLQVVMGLQGQPMAPAANALQVHQTALQCIPGFPSVWA